MVFGISHDKPHKTKMPENILTKTKNFCFYEVIENLEKYFDKQML